MTLPRQFPPDCPHHSIGRYVGGRFLSPPIPDIINAFLMIVAVNAQRYEIGIAGWALMGNHPHLAVFDRDPTRPSLVPKFRRQVHSQFAKFLKVYWNLDDLPQIFGVECVSQLFPIVDEPRVVSTLAYMMNNPVEAGIVAHPDEMPAGAVSLPAMLDVPFEVSRPDIWFSPRTWPKTVTIQIEVPPSVGCSRRVWRARLESAVFVRSHALGRERVDHCEQIQGVETAQQKTADQSGKVIRNKVHVLASGSTPAVMHRFFDGNRLFRRSYRRSYENLQAGRRDVVFPFGSGAICSSQGCTMQKLDSQGRFSRPRVVKARLWTG